MKKKKEREEDGWMKEKNEGEVKVGDLMFLWAWRDETFHGDPATSTLLRPFWSLPVPAPSTLCLLSASSANHH